MYSDSSEDDEEPSQLVVAQPSANPYVPGMWNIDLGKDKVVQCSKEACRCKTDANRQGGRQEAHVNWSVVNSIPIVSSVHDVMLVDPFGYAYDEAERYIQNQLSSMKCIDGWSLKKTDVPRDELGVFTCLHGII